MMSDDFLRDIIRASEDKFSSDSEVYVAPTSNVKSMCNLFDNYESILTVGGSGAIGFESVLRGAHTVDCFDINQNQKSYFSLVYNFVKHNEYEDFIKYFSSEYGGLLSFEMFDATKGFLDDYDLYNLEGMFINRRRAFRLDYDLRLNYLRKFCSYYNKEEYDKLRERINSLEDINYEVCNVSDIDKVFKGKKYDKIFFDNIFQYYHSIKTLDNVDLVDKFIRETLSDLLVDDGIIQVNYGFAVSTAAVKEEFDNVKISNDLLMDSIIGLEKKEGINNLLLRKYGNYYNVDYIPGVESSSNQRVDNFVLTYKKK